MRIARCAPSADYDWPLRDNAAHYRLIVGVGRDLSESRTSLRALPETVSLTQQSSVFVWYLRFYFHRQKLQFSATNFDLHMFELGGVLEQPVSSGIKLSPIQRS